MLMIEPPPAAFIGPIAAFMPSQQPTAFTSRIRRKSSRGMSAIGANFSTPALLTSTSSLPKVSTAAATAAAHSASLVTSWWMYRQDCPSSPAATLAPLSSRTSPKTTRAPSATKWRTCDLPIPRAPPVISATLPSSRPMVPPGASVLWGRRPGDGDPVEEDPQESVHHLIGAVAAGAAPLLRDPQDVPQQPIGELGVQVRPEQARLLACLQLRDPDALDLAQGLGQVGEPGLGGEVVPVVLQHREGRPVLGEGAAGGAHDLLERGPRALRRGDRGAVVAEHLVDEARQDLVADRLLGVEVVIQAPRQDLGGIGDLAHGRGAIALLREKLAGQHDHVRPAL